MHHTFLLWNVISILLLPVETIKKMNLFLGVHMTCRITLFLLDVNIV